jgi:glycosyltransferase involved in cell wall biosynthesis
MSTSIIIPALNEEYSLGAVLESIPEESVTQIIVVDGGSTDGTVAVAEAGGSEVIPEPRRGYGRACAAGLAHASGEFVVFMDADGADDPSQIPTLLAPLLEGRADLVLGSRLAGDIAPGAMPWHQRFGNHLSAWLFRALYSLSISDLSPFRAARREKLLGLEMAEMTYGWPTEMIAKAARQKWRIVELPVRYRPRLGGRSKISGTIRGTVLATYYILKTIFKYRIR